MATAYGMQLLLEFVDARCNHRRPRFAGGLVPLVDFLLSAHITALAIAMLLYFNDRLWVVAFATAVAIASKTLFRAPFGSRDPPRLQPVELRHHRNAPSVPRTVGLMMPWQFTEELSGFLDWGLLGLIFCLGSFINGRFTKRLPLIAAWLGVFVLQAALRSRLFQTSFPASLAPMTGIAFMLFTFYMVPDPATTPTSRWAQAAFGGSVAGVYGVLMALHVVFALFIALTLVCAAHGVGLYAVATAAGLRPSLQGELNAPN